MSIFDDLVDRPSEKEQPETGNPTFTDQAALLSNLAHVPANVGGFLGDIVTEGGKALVKRFRPDIQDPDFAKPSESDTVHLPGFGEASKVFQSLTDKVVPRRAASNPVAQHLADFTEMAASLAAGGGEASVPQILKTAGGVYAGSHIADRLFPGSEMAQFLGGLVGGAGPHIIEGGVRSAVSARNIVNGASHPAFKPFTEALLSNEGGGTLNAPKTSKKGALGPWQVMPETSKDPGFGIRPWDGKSQADLARVGKQYAAALINHYKGDTAKAFAAYNGGVGRVDAALKAHGADWLNHLPDETQKYVADGVRKMGGEPPVASNEPVDNVIDFPSDRVKLPYIRAEDIPLSSDVRDMLPDHLKPIFDKMNMDQNITPEERAALEEPLNRNRNPLTPAERQDMDASVPTVPVDNTGYEKHTPYIDEPNAPANDIEGQTDLDKKLQEHLNTPENLAEAKKVWEDAHEEYVSKFRQPDDYNSALIRQKGGTGRKFTMTPEEAQKALEHADSKVQSFWEKSLQAVKDMLGDDSGALDLGKIFGQRKKPYGESGPDGSAFDGLSEEKKLAKAIKTLRPANAEQIEANRQVRQDKFAHLDKLQQEPGGLEGFKQQAAALRGSVPKVDFESISHHFSDEERDNLLNKITASRTLRPAEKFKAQQSLLKMLNKEGTVLPTKSELKLLSKVLHDQTVEELNKKVLSPDRVGLLEKLWNTINAAKTIGDWSDLTKSNATMFLTPGYWKTLGNFAKGGFFGKGSYQSIRNATRSHPDYDLLKEMNISHTGKGEAMDQHEEIFKSNLLEHVPGLSHVMDASERVYSGVANEVRDHAALRMIEKDRKAGIDVEDPAYLKQAGELINTLTGRASFGRSKLGIAVERGMPFISKVLWTPRQYASWVKMAGYAVNPKFWINASPAMRTQLATGFLSLTAWTASNLAIASSLGYEVHKNILDPLFGKYKIGDTIYDASAGRGSTLHAIATAISGNVVKDGQVQKLGDNPHAWLKSRGDVVMHWARTHASPAAALIENEFEGKDLAHPVNAVGNKQDWTKWMGKETLEGNPLYSAMVPMSAEGTIEAGQHYGWDNRQTYETGIGEMFGRQANTQEPRPPKASKRKGDTFDNLVNPSSKDDPFESLVNPKKSEDVFNNLVSQ